MNVQLPRAAAALLTAALAACRPSASPAPVAPYTAQPVAHESELLRLSLSPEAQQRLGIRTVAAQTSRLDTELLVHGEVLVAAAGGSTPISSGNDLAGLAANQARADGELARAAARLQIAQRAAERAATLLADEAGSQRALDEAEAALGVAQADLDVARVQRAQLGPALQAMNAGPVLWLRVAVGVADLGRIDPTGPASVTSFGDTQAPLTVQPIAAPPSANAVAGSVDLYYALPNADRRFRVGERVAVTLPGRHSQPALAIPASAVIRDIYGGEWVYVELAERSYERRPIEVARSRDGEVLLARGLAAGTRVVADGAAELFGSEFGTR